MKIDQKVKQLTNVNISASELAKNAVAFSTRSIETNIVVNSNDTAVLGGLMQDNETETVTKVPILGDIPIIGWLFKGKTTEKKKSNLLIFITPKIMRNSQDNADLLNAKLNERVDFIQQNLKGRDPHGSEVDKLPRRALVEEETQEYIAPQEPAAGFIQSPNEATDEPADDANPGVIPGDAEEGE